MSIALNLQSCSSSSFLILGLCYMEKVSSHTHTDSDHGEKREAEHEYSEYAYVQDFSTLSSSDKQTLGRCISCTHSFLTFHTNA